MVTMQERVREHAVAEGILAPDDAMNSYVAEGAAWCADACAHAVRAGADLRDVSAELCLHMRHAGASGAEQAFAQLVIAEIEALVGRVAGAQEDDDVFEAIVAHFEWTERVHVGGAIKHLLRIENAGDLSARERLQSKQIYETALLAHFGSRARAFRAWAVWAADPDSEEAAPWRAHHDRAQQLAFAGLDLVAGARVSVRFSLHP